MRAQLQPKATSTPKRIVPLLFVVSLVGCEDKSKTESTDPIGSSSTSPEVSSAPAASSAAAEDQPPSAPLELQELTFTSEVKNKEPVDTLLAAEPATRVWAHLRLRNRDDTPRKIHLEFRVNDDKRTTLDLAISKSWSYRTWAYNTLLDGDKKGTVSLKVTDDSGAVLAETSVPIAPKARTKPYVKSAK
jgi:hypothetical protein